MLAPQEEVDRRYYIDERWFSDAAERPDGISVIIRTRDEGHLIGEAIDSLGRLELPYEINVVMNLCADATEQRVELRQASGMPVNIFEYPYQVAKPGLENYCTPVESIHSSVWYYNWALSQSRYRYTMKWDTDMMASYEFLRELEARYDHAKTTNFSTMFFDTQGLNHESFLNLNTGAFQYFKWKCYETPRHWEDSQQDLAATVLHLQSNTGDKAWRRAAPWWEADEASPAAELTRQRHAEWLRKIPGFNQPLRASHDESHSLMAQLPVIEEHIGPIASPSMCFDPSRCPAERIKA